MIASIQGWLDIVINWMLSQGYQIVLILVFMFVFIRLADRYANRLVHALIPKKRRLDSEYHKRADTLGNVVHYLFTFVLVIIAITLIFNVLDIQIGPILAAAGVLGLAVGFGAQSLV